MGQSPQILRCRKVVRKSPFCPKIFVQNVKFVLKTPVSARLFVEPTRPLVMIAGCVQLSLLAVDNDDPPVRSDPRFIFVVVNDPNFDRCDVRTVRFTSAVFVVRLYCVLDCTHRAPCIF